jgi:multidrug efflux system membrane fusion protein
MTIGNVGEDGATGGEGRRAARRAVRGIRSWPARARRRSARAIAVVLGAAVSSACGKVPPTARPKIPVTVAVATAGPAPYVVTANGIVEPIQTVAVQSQVQGVLTAVRFREGDEVREGDVLFEIDPRPFQAAVDQARAVLARDLAQAENARRDAERYAALVQKDYVTRSQADQAAANAAAQLAVVRADSAALANARFNLDNATIRAPIAGKTGALLVRQGNLVRPGAAPPLVVINQIHPIVVRFAVPERELGRIQAYARQHPLKAVATTATGGPGVEGRLSFIDNGVDTTTGAVTLKARFDNADNALWPGEFVQVALELFVQPDAVLVPTEAVMPGQDSGQFVFEVGADGKARVTPVRAGRTVGNNTVIEAGLVAGARVVTDGQSRLVPGALVDVRGGQAVARRDSAGRGGRSGRAGS